MSRPRIGAPPARRLEALAAPFFACVTWLLWSGTAVAADVTSAHSIACKAKAVHAFRDVQASKSWDVDDQLVDPSLVFDWRPRAPKRPSIEIDGRIGQLISMTDTTVLAVHGSSDRLTVRRWLYAINFRLENVVGIQLESNAVSVNGRVAEFVCDFEAAL